MVSESTFVQNIRENPGDWGAVLVYCDWLEENGQARKAEYFRIVHRLRTEEFKTLREARPLVERGMELYMEELVHRGVAHASDFDLPWRA